MIVDHDAITGCCLLGHIHPVLDHIKAALQRVQERHQGRAGDMGPVSMVVCFVSCPVTCSTLLSLIWQRARMAWPLQFFPSCVLCLATGDDGDIHCDARHLLDGG